MSYAINAEVGLAKRRRPEVSSKGSRSPGVKVTGSRMAFGQSSSHYGSTMTNDSMDTAINFFIGAGPDEDPYYIGADDNKESFESSFSKLPERFRKMFSLLDWKQLSPALASVFFSGVVKEAYSIMPLDFKSRITLEDYGYLCEQAVKIDKILPLQTVEVQVGGLFSKITKAVKKVGSSVAKGVKAVTKKLTIKNLLKVAPFALAIVPGIGTLAAAGIAGAANLIKQKQEQAQALRDAANQATSDQKAQAEYDAQAAAQAAAEGAAAAQAASAAGMNDAQAAAKAEAAYEEAMKKFKATVPPPPPVTTLLPANPPAGFASEDSKAGYPIYQEGMPIPKGTIFVVGYDVGAETMRIVDEGSTVQKGELVKAAFPITIKNGMVKRVSNSLINKIWTSNSTMGKVSIVSGGVLLLGLGGFFIYKAVAKRNK